MHMLHAIEHVKNEKDATLAYRWNCGAGRCGSCAAEVNGKPVLLCKYEVRPEIKEYTVQPMKVFPVVKDLVVDLTAMREGLKKIPGFKSGQKPFYKMYDYDSEISREMRKCIECGICQDVCHVLREHKKGYLGPRFAVKAASLDMHPKDSQNRASDMEKAGLGYCNVTKCCQSVCPEKIRITDDAIIPLKEKITELKRKEFVDRIFGGGKK
jgi:succinate dehydrogenase / fumarate reductase iron-sulfur subunit